MEALQLAAGLLRVGAVGGCEMAVDGLDFHMFGRQARLET